MALATAPSVNGPNGLPSSELYSSAVFAMRCTRRTNRPCAATVLCGIPFTMNTSRTCDEKSLTQHSPNPLLPLVAAVAALAPTFVPTARPRPLDSRRTAEDSHRTKSAVGSAPGPATPAQSSLPLLYRWRTDLVVLRALLNKVHCRRDEVLQTAFSQLMRLSRHLAIRRVGARNRLLDERLLSHLDHRLTTFSLSEDLIGRLEILPRFGLSGFDLLSLLQRRLQNSSVRTLVADEELSLLVIAVARRPAFV